MSDMIIIGFEIYIFSRRMLDLFQGTTSPACRQTCDWISHLEAILKPSSSLEIDRLVQGAG